MISTPITSKLAAHQKSLRKVPLKQLFLDNPDRFSAFSAEAAGLFVDYSKNWITAETMDLLCQFATEKKVPEAIQALLSGEKVNLSEGRAALHTVLRLPETASFMLDGVDIAAQSQAVLQQMADIAEKLKQKTLLGYSGKPIESILHVGMGGSGLGPELYYQAMSHEHKNAICHFIIDFDYAQLQSKLALCNPETTLVVLVSKSFATEEVLIIFESIKQWLNLEGEVATQLPTTRAASELQKKQSQLYAVTARADRALAKGFLQNNILTMWDWVGGRFSIWSAVSFSLILAFGINHFRRFLSGAYAMDQHVATTPLQHNLPVIMALLTVWYNNFFDAHSKAVVPYTPTLATLPSYLQQLHMESLGKSVDQHGNPIAYPTGQVIWGDVGPRSQHSFHQLLMQGTQMIPVDFILPLHLGSNNEYDVKRAAYCLSQSQTLLAGFDAEKSYQRIDGNRPSTIILIDQLTPETLGALLALYEHSVFVQSVLWDINAFDQWGVERGKKVAEQLTNCITDGLIMDSLDSSTKGLLQRIKK